MLTKIMTQSFNDPKYYRTTGDILDTYFTNRYKTQLNSDTSVSQIIDFSRTEVSYNDDFWSSFPFIAWFYEDDEVDATAYDPSYGMTEWTYLKGFPTLHSLGTYGFASFTMAQEPLEVRINYYPLTIGNVLSEIGSRFIGLFGIFYFLISSYESFSFRKSAIKAFYFSDTENRINRNSSVHCENPVNRLR